MSEGQGSQYEHMLEIPVEAAPGRIVSLVPSMTESLFDLNLGGRLVGRTEYCIYPADKVGQVPTIGGTKNINVPAIIDLRPDLVIANKEENNRADIEALRAAGIPLWLTFPHTVQDVFNMLWNLMYLCEETAMVPRVRLIEQTYDWVAGIARQYEDDPTTVFVPIWNAPLMTFNRETFAHHLLADLGGWNVFADRERQYPLKADLGTDEAYAPDDPRVAERDTRYPRITLDEVVAAQPEVILLPSEPYPFTEADKAQFEALDIPAAKNKRIHLVDGSLLTWHGTRLAYTFDIIPPLLAKMGAAGGENDAKGAS